MEMSAIGETHKFAKRPHKTNSNYSSWPINCNDRKTAEEESKLTCYEAEEVEESLGEQRQRNTRQLAIYSQLVWINESPR